MKSIVACDFDGTITTKDSLYSFFETYASKKWQDVEQLWKQGKIGSKECLIEEFSLVENLNEELIENYTKTIQIDPYFKEFLDFLKQKNIDFVIISDGIDYFIKRILKNGGINCENIKIITNHAQFQNGIFTITYPNDNNNCKKNSGTCKCKIVKDLKNQYEKVFYIGDSTSDFCVSDKVDYLFAKDNLSLYCSQNKIKFEKYSNFKEVMDNDLFRRNDYR